MNNDEFENELSQLRPAKISPGLTQAIAERIDAPAGSARTKRIVAGLFAGLAAACLILFFWLGNSHPPPANTKIETANAYKLTPEQIENLPPTQNGYALAARSSPEDLRLFEERMARTLLPEIKEK